MRKNRKTFLITCCLFLLSCLSTTYVSSTPSPLPPTQPATAIPLKVEAVEIANATIVYYDIFGFTGAELREQLNMLGPTDYAGFKGDAVTEWYIHWNWPGYGTSNCDLSVAAVSYDMKVILPRWSPPQDASTDLVAKWISYVNALSLHEQGHVDHVVENFQRVVDAIQGATCDTADAVGTAILEELRHYDVEYDANTQHGAAQGAIFP